MSKASFILAGALTLGGCAAASSVHTVTLPLSGEKVDIVRNRSGVDFADCGTIVGIQTYNAKGELIDSKAERGHALHCDVIVTGIEAGGRSGAAYLGRTVNRVTNNLNNSSGSASNSNSNATANPTATSGA